MLYWLNPIALLVLIALISAAIWFRCKRKPRSPTFSRMPDIIIAVLSLGAWALTLDWRLDPTTRVIGFPFTAAIFELHRGVWVDYVCAITLPALAANLVFWLLLFRLPLVWYRST